MKQKLFPNIRHMTNLFCIGIFCVTLAVLALRLTVFSDMAASVPPETVSSIVESDEGGYKMNGKPVFASATAKGDIFISNAEGNAYKIKVDITLEEDGKSILSTGLIKPGDSVDSMKLNPLGQQLEDGLYPCVAEITAHDPDTLKPVGSARENILVQIGDVDEDKAADAKDNTDDGTEDNAGEDAASNADDVQEEDATEE